MRVGKAFLIIIGFFSSSSYAAGESKNYTDLVQIKDCIGFYKAAGDIAYDGNELDKSGVAYTYMMVYMRAADRLGGDGKYEKNEEKFSKYTKQANIDAIKSARVNLHST